VLTLVLRQRHDRGTLAEPANSADLAAAARAGDRAAFAVLHDRYGRMVHAILLARTPFGAADDLVQDVFLAALERIGELRQVEAFGGWLAQIARNRAVDYLRARRHDELPAAEDSVANGHAAAEAHEALAAIRALPDAYRETLLMRLVEGLSGPEIAERTGLTPGSVRVNLHRGMQLLRERLGIPNREGSIDV
jgi:RNA polymerase sigma-70 factor, ECF subfamily